MNFFRALFLCLLFVALPVRAGESDQLKDLQKDQLWIHVDFIEGTTGAVIHFRVWFKGKPEKAFQVLTDTNSLKALSNFTDARTLTKQMFERLDVVQPQNVDDVKKSIQGNVIASDHNRRPRKNWTNYTFYQFNFPWPLKDRWAVQKIRLDETNYHQGEYKYKYTTEHSNMKALKGQWFIKPVKDKPGYTEWYGEYQTDPGVSAPKFLLKKGVVSGFKKDVQAYRERIQSK